MSETLKKQVPRRKRIFPEIQWNDEQIATWKAEQEAFKKRCQVIFEKLKPELIKTHYNWYMAVEPESEDYYLAQSDLIAIKMLHQKHPNDPFYLFRINETGVSGTL